MTCQGSLSLCVGRPVVVGHSERWARCTFRRQRGTCGEGQVGGWVCVKGRTDPVDPPPRPRSVPVSSESPSAPSSDPLRPFQARQRRPPATRHTTPRASLPPSLLPAVGSCRRRGGVVGRTRVFLEKQEAEISHSLCEYVPFNRVFT